MTPTRFRDLLHTEMNLFGVRCAVNRPSADRSPVSEYFAITPRIRHGVLMAEGGSVRYEGEGWSLVLPDGGVAFLPRGARYTTHYDEGVTVHAVAFRLFGEEGEELGLFAPTLLTENAPEELRASVHRAVELFMTSSDLLSIKCEALATVRFLSLLDYARGSEKSLKSALDYIHNHLNEELRVSDLARMSAMCESAFRREFAATIGKSPKTYILDCKLQKSKEMLSTSSYTIKEICSALGFFDDAYFSKLFKRATGLTPMQYRIAALRK